MGRATAFSIEHARNVAHIANLLFTALQPLNHLPPAAGKLAGSGRLPDRRGPLRERHQPSQAFLLRGVPIRDMPGFTERERLLVAALCAIIRKTLPSSVHTTYQTLTADERRTLLLLIPLLRLAG